MLEAKTKIIIVLSGKGGVGKSFVAAQLALHLSRISSESPVQPSDELTIKQHLPEQKETMFNIGLLDVDLCGPSLPSLLDIPQSLYSIKQSSKGWRPVAVNPSLSLLSIAFLLQRPGDAVIWRGPKKSAMISQFLASADWSGLDFLIVDTPPGTSDEHLALVECLRTQYPQNNVSAVIVTTPQAMALVDVAKEITFCKTVGLKIAGLVENMSGYRCPHCEHCINVFASGGGKALAQQAEIEFLGSIPIEPSYAAVGNTKKEIPEIAQITQRLLEIL